MWASRQYRIGFGLCCVVWVGWVSWFSVPLMTHSITTNTGWTTESWTYVWGLDSSRPALTCTSVIDHYWEDGSSTSRPFVCATESYLHLGLLGGMPISVFCLGVAFLAMAGMAARRRASAEDGDR